jgi:hypothetical protein
LHVLPLLCSHSCLCRCCSDHTVACAAAALITPLPVLLLL